MFIRGQMSTLLKIDRGIEQQRLVSCAWSNREWEGSCNVCQTRDDPKVLCVSLPCIGFRVCEVCAAELISKLESAANARISDESPRQKL